MYLLTKKVFLSIEKGLDPLKQVHYYCNSKHTVVLIWLRHKNKRIRHGTKVAILKYHIEMIFPLDPIT